MLNGQRTRSIVLASVFGAAATVILADEGLQRLRHVATPVPTVVVPFILLLGLQQLLLARRVAHHIRTEQSISRTFWLASAFIEVTLVTCVIAAMAPALDVTEYALVAPAVLVYFIFIIFSTLHLDPRISVFTGAIAGAEFIALALYLLTNHGSADELPMLIGSPLPYVMKSLLLVGGGVGAAFVARQLRTSIERTVQSGIERDRVAAADRAKTTFLAHMSHEIRAPLNAVLGYAELLRRDSDLNDDQRHAVTTIGTSGSRLLAVVNQVLDLSRIEAGQHDLRVRAFELSTLLRDLYVMFEFRCRQKQLSWRIDDGADVADAPVLGDPDRLHQVLINLLDNAVRATTTGGVLLEVQRDGDRVRFHVMDTGNGIDPINAETIFEPFRQADARSNAAGAGLGLAIARAQTALMGGTLTLAASSHAGTRFTLDVPLPHATHNATNVAEGTMRLAHDCRIRAIVADDTPADRDILVRFLNRIGVDAQAAADVDALLTAVRAEPKHVAFIDARLAGDVTDGSIAHALHEAHRAGVRTIGVSASALMHERAAILAAGFDGFLAKPVSEHEIVACITAALPASRFESEDAGDADHTEHIVDSARQQATVRHLPRDIWLQLRAAAETCSITDLRHGLDRLDELEEGMEPLSSELRALTRTYDMERIVNLLDGIPHV
jgi:signal transduction histidine kinase/DNA-binding response OmpR family regulator